MDKRACAPWNDIFKSWKWWHQSNYSCFKINRGFYHSRQSHRVYHQWRIQSVNVSGYIVVKNKNTAIYRTQQTMFWQDCFPHLLQVVRKSAVLDCKSKDDEGKIGVCIETSRKSIATYVTWMKKSSLSSRALTKAQNNVGLKPVNMLTPIKTRWEYLISTIHCLIENHSAIDYMYVPMAVVEANITQI